jgi:hypothetical protein
MLRPELVARPWLEPVPNISRMMDRKRLAEIGSIMGEEINHLAAMSVDDLQPLTAPQSHSLALATPNCRHDPVLPCCGIPS